MIRYVPNANHSLSGEYLTRDLISFFYRVVNNIDLPVLDWELLDRNLNVSLDYNGEYSVSTWKAFNENGRDFRLWQEGKLWKKSNMKKKMKITNPNIEIENNNTGYKLNTRSRLRNLNILRVLLFFQIHILMKNMNPLSKIFKQKNIIKKKKFESYNNFYIFRFSIIENTRKMKKILFALILSVIVGSTTTNYALLRLQLIV